MTPVRSRSVRAIGEAMIEMAPVGDGLYRRGFAGDTFNTAWHMAQWLGPRAEVGMLTRVGQDRLSNAFLDEMAQDGMLLTGISRDPVRGLGLYMIELDGVERSFHYWRDSSAARLLADDAGFLTRALEGVGLVHLSGITLAILSPAARDTLCAVLADFRAQGGTVSFDPNIRPRLWSSMEVLRQTVTRMLSLCDIALPSLDDERAHFGDRSAEATLDRLSRVGVAEIVVKDGDGPVLVQVDGQRVTVPTPALGSIRDTTGAGDAFNAGYLAGRMLGHDALPSVGLGQRMAGVVLGHFGARAPKEAIAALPDPATSG